MAQDQRNALVRRNPVIDQSAFDVPLPSNIDAEKTILGAILLDNEAWPEAAEKITADDFSLDSNRRIFLRMKGLMDAGGVVDIITLANELAIFKEVETVGGVAYLASLTEGLPRRPVIDEYILIVKDKAMLRRLMALGSVTVARAADQSETALEVAGSMASDLEEIISGGLAEGLQHVSEMTIEVMDRYKTQALLLQSPGLSFGVDRIDVATGGMQEGEQIVTGCYSGVGKTTLLAQVVAANCAKGVPCAVFLLEPSRHDFLRRVYSIVADVPYTPVPKPWLAPKEDQEKMDWASRVVFDWPLYINDRSTTTLDELIPQAKLAIHRHGVEFIGLDYLQRLKVKSEGQDDNIRLKVGRVSTAIADMVKNTKCRSMLLSQFSRGGGMIELPTMDKLRESGQIENDAMTILLMHLEWDEEQGHFTDEGCCIIPKQRFGVPTSVPMYKDSRTALWMSGKKPAFSLTEHWSDK